MSGTSSAGFTLQLAIANPLAELFILDKGVRTVEEHFGDKLTPVQITNQLTLPTKSA